MPAVYCAAGVRRHILIAVLILFDVGPASSPVLGQRPVRGLVPVDVFLPAPRELQRELHRAQEDIAAERFVDAITRLDLILRGDTAQPAEISEDYFLPRAGDAAFRSLRMQAEQVLQQLPRAGREAYELAYGTDARRLLSSAIERRDVEGIAEVVRQFGHTQAGSEASMLLGRERLADGKPLEAVLHFQRLANSPITAERFGAELQLLLASSLNLSGRTEQAKQVLERFRENFKDAEVDVAGSPITVFEQGEEALDWLTSIVGQLNATGPEPLREWRLFGGSADRAGTCIADRPIRAVHWDVPFARYDERNLLERQAKALREQAVTPTLHPLVVGSWVLMRSSDQLWGIDLETGLRKWQYPPWPEASESDGTLAPNPYGRLGASRRPLLQQRVWEDSLYGQLSSDGESAYLLNQLNGNYSLKSTGAALSNELVAIDLNREGYLLWSVGGADGGDDAALAGVFFLSPPLPVDGSLYSIGEMNGEVRLMALDASDGHLLWSQQLAHIDVRPGRDPGQDRRMAGLNLCYSDGVLVCPTSLGGVVAVDITRRAFLWGFQYGKQVRRQGYTRRGTTIRDRWRDNSAMIANGKVILTPWDSNEIYCLDLLTGTMIWENPRLRGTNIFVAGAHEDRVILVGRSSVSSIQLASGQDAWSLALDGSPSGRGIQSGSTYLLPTTIPELVRIDLDSGTVIESVRVDEPLGNLVAAGDQLISQSSQRLRAFYQRSRLEDRVQRRLAANPEDPWALEHQAILLLDEDRKLEGLEFLRRAISQFKDSESGDALAAKQLMVSTGLELLLENAPGSQQLASEIEPLIERRSEARNEFLRIMMTNLRRDGQLEAAFQRNLDLFRNQSAQQRSLTIRSEGDLLKVSRHRQIRPDRWHRAMFRDVWNDADERQRDKIRTNVEATLDTAKEDQRTPLLLVLQDLPFLRQAVMDMLREQIQTNNTDAITEGQLLRMAQTDDASLAGQAHALLAELYQSFGKYAAAASSYHTLAGQYSDVSIHEGRTGSEIATDSVRGNATVRAHFEMQNPWNQGKVKVSPLRDTTPVRVMGAPVARFDAMNRVSPVNSQTPYGNTPFGLQLVYDQIQASLQGRDAMGNVHPIARLTTALPGIRGARDLRLQTNGHLIVGVRDESIVAINAIAANVSGEEAIIWQDSGSGGVGYSRRFSPTRTLAFGQMGNQFTRTIESGSNRRSPVSLGPVTEFGVVLRRYGDLVCLDPETGDVIWMRNDVDLAAEVWGDEQHVIVHVPGPVPGRDQNARVFATLDGSEVESQPVPDQRNRVRAFGSYVLSWNYAVEGEVSEDVEGILENILETGESLNHINPRTVPEDARKVLVNRLQLSNVFDRTKTAEWTRTFAFDAKAAFLNDREFVVFDPDARRIQVFEVMHDQPHIDFEVDTALEKVDSIRVETRAGLYIVTLAQHTTGRRGNKVVHRTPDALLGKLANLEVYALNQDGELVWGHPAKLQDFIQAPVFAADVPILVFLRVDEVTSRAPRRQQLHTVVLDVRDGHAIHEDISTYEGRTLQVRGDNELNQVNLRVPATGGAWRLEFTDQPRTVGLPYGQGEPNQTGIIRSVFDLFRSVVPSPSSQPIEDP